MIENPVPTWEGAASAELVPRTQMNLNNKARPKRRALFVFKFTMVDNGLEKVSGKVVRCQFFFFWVLMALKSFTTKMEHHAPEGDQVAMPPGCLSQLNTGR